jgi:uncharacterized heparinase superfamily protein
MVRTVRHLTPRQIVARAYLAARYRLYAQVPRAARSGLAGPVRPDAHGLQRLSRWLALRHPGPPSAHERELATDAMERRFSFLHRSGTAPGRVDWQAQGMSRLWAYHLHYTDAIRALALGAARGGDSRWQSRAQELIDDWIAANPPGSRPGWEPYPLSLRAVNWVAAWSLCEPGWDPEQRNRLLASLGAQGRFLARHLEWHLGGNHLVKNAKALLVLGTALDCREAASWRTRGLEILFEQMRVQILADGGHYERSPLYHGQVLEDLLDALAIAGASPPDVPPSVDLAELRRKAVLMTDWLARMRHPDGGLAVFNDCVEAGDPTPAELLAYAQRVLDHAPAPLGSTQLPASGYFVLERGAGRAVIDCGEVGPDELPAHAHADTLSFELSWAGRRWAVDSGTSEYALDDLRRYVRSTAAHNTVMVDGAEQSEVWGSHRVGRRARPGRAQVVETADHVRFAGAHDGYDRLGVIHHRHVIATDQAWIVVDELRGRGRHRFASHLHLHPKLRLEAAGASWRAVGGAQNLLVRPLGPVTCEPSEGWYCPDWGIANRGPVLIFHGEGEAPSLFGYAVAPEDVQLEVGLEADETGVTVSGGIGGRTIRMRSDRCRFSS